MTSLDSATREIVQQAFDSDGLVSGSIFEDLELEAVLIGNYWVGLDSRIPWQLAQGIRSQFEDLSSVRLRLDLSRVEPREGHQTPFRKAHWWGAKFDWAKVVASRQGRETRYADPERMLPRLKQPPQAAFWWNFPRDQTLGEFQIEEFNVELGGELMTRYLHAIIDTKTQRFVHVDGALKTYSEDTYLSAYEQGVSKASVYEKLFRVDSSMDKEKWIVLVGTFFMGSALVREYFDGE